MAEKAVLEFAAAVRDGRDPRSVRGLCYIAKEPREGYLELPAYETVAQDKAAFIEMFHTFYRNNDPVSAHGLYQKHGDRFLIQNPPALTETQAELDAIYALDFERRQHPYYEQQGKVKALETIGFSISTHRGCYGECNFCAIAVHEGTTVRWRSPESILAEAERLTHHPDFKGYIQDLGGPTANMYGFECDKKLAKGICTTKRCVYSGSLPVDEGEPPATDRPAAKGTTNPRCEESVRGLRYPLRHAAVRPRRMARITCAKWWTQHVSGQMKVAPEHTEENVLRYMGKPGSPALLEFKQRFDSLNREAGKRQFLTYYLIAAHPGCTEADMQRLRDFASQKLQIHPEQVQIFTPTPSTYSSLMYYTELDPFTGKAIFVEKDARRKERQKEIVTDKKTIKNFNHEEPRRGFKKPL